MEVSVCIGHGSTPFLPISYIIFQHCAQWKLMAPHSPAIQLNEGTLPYISSTMSNAEYSEEILASL